LRGCAVSAFIISDANLIPPTNAGNANLPNDAAAGNANAAASLNSWNVFTAMMDYFSSYLSVRDLTYLS